MAIKTKKTSPMSYAIYDYMKEHVGEKNAISARDLSRKFSLSERELRIVINEIRNNPMLERIIGSSTRGYFLCTQEEFERTNNRLKSQAFSLLQVAYANEKKAAHDGQMKMKIGRYVKEQFEAFSRQEKMKESAKK